VHTTEDVLAGTVPAEQPVWPGRPISKTGRLPDQQTGQTTQDHDQQLQAA
jgi:hypothetical protein